MCDAKPKSVGNRKQCIVKREVGTHQSIEMCQLARALLTQIVFEILAIFGKTQIEAVVAAADEQKSCHTEPVGQVELRKKQ